MPVNRRCIYLFHKRERAELGGAAEACARSNNYYPELFEPDAAPGKR
jgi:hypothetical protein